MQLRWRRRRWHSRSTAKKVSRKKIFFLVLIIVFVCSIQSFIYLDRHITPTLIEIASIRLKQTATEALNQSITQKVSQGANFDDLVDWKTDNNGKVTGFMLNYGEHMKITTRTEQVVKQTLDELQKLPEYIPFGQAMGSPLLATMTPDIPVHFVPAGAVKVELGTRKSDAAINMLLIEVYIRVTVEVAIIIPFETQSQIVQTEVPISYILVSGDVPMYYFNGQGEPIGSGQSNMTPPSISIPGPGFQTEQK